MTNYSQLGYISVDWSNAARDANWYAWRVYRRQVGVGWPWVMLYETKADTTYYNYRDWAARVGTEYQYSVVQVATRFGQPVESDYPISSVIIPASDEYWLVHPTDETLNVRLHVKSDSFKERFEQADIDLIGRGTHTEYGTQFGFTGSIAGSIRRDSALTPAQQRARIQDLRRALSSFYLRTPFGDVWKVTTGDITFDRLAGVGAEEMCDVSFEYKQVA